MFFSVLNSYVALNFIVEILQKQIFFNEESDFYRKWSKTKNIPDMTGHTKIRRK